MVSTSLGLLHLSHCEWTPPNQPPAKRSDYEVPFCVFCAVVADVVVVVVVVVLLVLVVRAAGAS